VKRVECFHGLMKNNRKNKKIEILNKNIFEEVLIKFNFCEHLKIQMFGFRMF